MPSQRVLSERSARWFYTLAGVLIVLAMAAAVIWQGPLPPRVVVMSTGTPGSDYDTVGRRYEAILKRSGITLKLENSGGGVENLLRLNDPHSGVSVSLAQGGLTTEQKSPALQSLGTVFYEPLWVFRRGGVVAASKDDFLGTKVSIGPEGGGTRVLAMQILALNGIDRHAARFLSLSAEEAGDALLRGDIDGAVMVASWDTDIVRRLLASPEVDAIGFPRADAYVALFPYLDKLILPGGVGNLAANRPPSDVNLVATKASLIVRRDLHPAIQYLLLEAAQEIHSAPKLFQKPAQFPAPERVDLPLSPHAAQFYKSGATFLQRYLPFWLAVLASRLLVLLIPLVGIAYPLLRVIPALYGWSMRHRIFRLYGELKFIEAEVESANGPADAQLAERLDRLEYRASRLRVPNAFANLLYQLRAHIGLVRGRVEQINAKG
jgi:TRAP transporter TAXI family solute receptor